MKKVVSFATVAVFVMLTITTIIEYSNKEISQLRSIPSQFRYVINVNSYDVEVLDALCSVANDKGVDIVRQVNSFDYNNNKSVVEEYVFTTSIYGKNCEVIEGRMLGSSDMDYLQTFVSTSQTKEKNQIGTIYGFNKSTVFYIRPLKALPQNYEIKGAYNICVSSQSDAEVFVAEVSEYLRHEYNIPFETEQYTININSSFQMDEDDNLSNVLLYVKVAALCTLFLIFAFSCVFLGKEIAVLKTTGYSTAESVFRAALCSLAGSVLLSFLISTIILLIADSLQTYLIVSTLPTIIICGIIELLIATITYMGYAARIKLTQTMKGQAPVRTVVVINLLCYILTSVICVAILNAAMTNISIVNKRTNNLSVWASIQDYGVFFPVSSGNDQDAIRRGEYPLDIPGYEFFKYANANEGAIYAASLLFTEQNDQLNADILNRIFVVNANYLLKFPVKDLNGNSVHIDEFEEKTVYLVQNKYRQREAELISVLSSDREAFHDSLHVGLYGCEERPSARELKIIYIADDQEFFSINPDVAPDKHNYINDAIVQVLTANNCLVPDINLFGGRPYLFIPLNGLAPADRKATLMEEINKNSLDDNLPSFVIPNTLIRQELDDLRVQTRALFAVMGIFAFLTIMTVSQAIISLFRINEYKCFILLSLGRPRAERWRGIVLPLVVAQVLIFIVCYAITGKQGLKAHLTLQATEIAFSIAVIVISEKKNIINVLKKGV